MRVRVPPPAPFFWREPLTRATWANQSAASSQIRCQRGGDGPFRGQKIRDEAPQPPASPHGAGAPAVPAPPRLTGCAVAPLQARHPYRSLRCVTLAGLRIRRIGITRNRRGLGETVAPRKWCEVQETGTHALAFGKRAQRGETRWMHVFESSNGDRKSGWRSGVEYLPSGQPAVGFSIATDESFTDKQGEKQERNEVP